MASIYFKLAQIKFFNSLLIVTTLLGYLRTSDFLIFKADNDSDVFFFKQQQKPTYPARYTSYLI